MISFFAMSQLKDVWGKKNKIHKLWWPAMQSNIKKNRPIYWPHICLTILRKWQLYSKLNPKPCWENKGGYGQQAKINSAETFIQHWEKKELTGMLSDDYGKDPGERSAQFPRVGLHSLCPGA